MLSLPDPEPNRPEGANVNRQQGDSNMNTEAVKQIAVPLVAKVLGEAAEEFVPEILDLAKRAVQDSRTSLDDVFLMPFIEALESMFE
jgi:hypothetical protein